MVLKDTIDMIRKEFGKESIMQFSDKPEPMPHIPTGAITLDKALGIGGLPKGRIVEIYGTESGGKTTLCLHAIKEAQAKGETCVFIDAEHSFDPIYAKNIGVDVNKLLVSQPDTGEQALDLAEMAVKSGDIGLVVVDSVTALVPRAELEGEMGDRHMGLQARLMSQALRKLTGIASKAGCTIIFINQLRMKIGVVFGNPETTTGGNSLKYYSSVRIDVRRKETLKNGDSEIGIKAKAKVVKNKVAPPYKTAELDILFGEGISTVGCIFDYAKAQKVITQAGSWYSYKDEKIGQGREACIQTLKLNEELLNKIKGELT